MKNVKMLIISNNSLSKELSNGRTICNLVANFKSENLASFSFGGGSPNFDICKNHYVITDGDALRCFLKRKSKNGKVSNESKNTINSTQTNSSKKHKKNALNMIIRNNIWSSMCWGKEYFFNWIEDFKPNCVLLQVSDLPFLIDLAVNIKEKYNIPLFVYNSEDYYYKNYNYFNHGKYSLFYSFFHKKYQKAFEKLMNIQNGCIYSMEDLEIKYKENFKHKSTSVYMSSSISYTSFKFKNNIKPQVCYLGNLGLNRHLGLIEIANALQSINKNYVLQVYGKAPNNEIEELLLNTPGLIYNGFVDYAKVQKVISSSDLLIHVEYFDEYTSRDIEYGFTTKIADSLCSGIPFLVYLPPQLKCINYFKRHDCAFVVEDRAKLKQALIEALTDEKKIYEILKNAKKVANDNHNFKTNANKFEKFIIENL